MEKALYYIVAIDLGTSRTGIAWGFKGAISDITEVSVRTNWEGCPCEYPKTYSDLAKCEGEWFYGADANSIILTGKNLERKKVNVIKTYRHYKMDLYDTKKEGKLNKQELLEVLTKELEFMKNVACKNMMDNMPGFEQTDFDEHVQWVLTVPEGAREEDKAFMRKAAIRAGLVKDSNEEFDRILFALEPEAAIINYMRDNKFTRIIEEDNYNIVLYDAGGGTVDVTVKQYKKNDRRGKLHTVVEGACAAAGSTYTDKAFFEYLENLFIETSWDLRKQMDNDRELKAEFYEQWLEAKETTSRCPEGEGKKYSQRIEIDAIWDLFREAYPDEYEKMQNQIMENGKKIVVGGRKYEFEGRKNKYLIIDQNVFKEICFPIFKEAYEPLKMTLNNLKKEKLKCNVICFAGGFSCNPFLREFIKEKVKEDFLEKIHFAARDNFRMGQAVLVGAVLFGANPTIIADRIVKRAYGTDVYDGDDPYGFSYFVKKGEIVSSDEKKTLIYKPHYSDQTEVSFKFYTTEKNDVKSIKDSSIASLNKEVTVKSPDTTKGVDRNIVVVLEFGGTQMRGKIVDEESGNEEHFELAISSGWSSQGEE